MTSVQGAALQQIEMSDRPQSRAEYIERIRPGDQYQRLKMPRRAHDEESSCSREANYRSQCKRELER